MGTWDWIVEKKYNMKCQGGSKSFSVDILSYLGALASISINSGRLPRITICLLIPTADLETAAEGEDGVRIPSRAAFKFYASQSTMLSSHFGLVPNQLHRLLRHLRASA